MGDGNTVGVHRKRGRQIQSRIKESGIGEVILEGGIKLTDGDLVACNKQILKESELEEANELCEIGKTWAFYARKIRKVQ